MKSSPMLWLIGGPLYAGVFLTALAIGAVIALACYGFLAMGAVALGLVSAPTFALIVLEDIYRAVRGLPRIRRESPAELRRRAERYAEERERSRFRDDLTAAIARARVRLRGKGGSR